MAWPWLPVGKWRGSISNRQIEITARWRSHATVESRFETPLTDHGDNFIIEIFIGRFVNLNVGWKPSFVYLERYLHQRRLTSFRLNRLRS
jgi:hypothetical protein